MTLCLDLPADIETALRARAAAAGQDIATFVAEVVTERLAGAEPDVEVAPAGGRRPPRRFAERLQSWVDLHPNVVTPIDDSRESIYAGRGE